MSPSSKRKRGVIYARVSSKEQEEKGYSIPSQKEWLEEKMERDGVKAVHPPIIDVESGRNFTREGLKKLVELSKSGSIDYVYVYVLERLGRNVAETPYLMYKLKEKFGVIVRTKDEEYNFEKPIDFVFATIKSLPGHVESNSIGERTLRGKIEKFKRGKWVGPVPRGYKKNAEQELEKLPGLEPVIVDIFETYKNHRNLKNTTQIINDRYMDEIGKLSPNQLRGILTKPVYVGKPKYAGVQTDSPSLSIVSPELYDKVQRLIRRSARKYKVKKYRKPRSILDDFAKEFGTDYVMRVLDILKPHCPKCQTLMIGNGSKEIRGLRVPNFLCRNCGYQKPVPSASELENFRGDILFCPKCKAAENFEINKTLHGLNEYLCKRCDFAFRVLGKHDRTPHSKMKSVRKIPIDSRCQDRPEKRPTHLLSGLLSYITKPSSKGVKKGRSSQGRRNNMEKKRAKNVRDQEEKQCEDGKLDDFM